jgi:hypothetical protein
MPEPTVIDTLPEEIRTTLSPEIVADQNITKYKNIPDLLNGHINLSKMISAKGVIVPKDDAKPEEWDKFYNTLGRPEKADGYKLSEMKELHPSIKVTPESTKAFFDLAHKAGFTAKQADMINQWYLGSVSQQLKAQDQAWNDKVVAAETALKTKWGQDYEKNVTLAKTLVAKAGGQAVIDGLGEAVNNPAVLEFLAKIGGHFAEDDFKSLGVTQQAAAPNADAIKKIEEIKGNKEHAYWNANDPKHNDAVEEVRKLYEIAYPNQAVAQ